MKTRSFILICLIIIAAVGFSYSASASGNPFSISGTVFDYNGTPVQGATVTLLSPSNNGNNIADQEIASTITDDNGKFQFINVTTESDTCKIKVMYTVGVPLYEQPSYRSLPASGTQYIDVRRAPVSDATPSPSPSSNIIVILIVGIFIVLCHKGNSE